MAAKSDIGSISSLLKITEISFTVGVSCVLSVAYFGGNWIPSFLVFKAQFDARKIVVGYEPRYQTADCADHINMTISTVVQLRI